MGRAGAQNDTVERARLFALLGDPIRLAVVHLLVHTRVPVSVGEIADEVAMSHSATSHALGVLFRVGIVDNIREGRVKYYVIAKSPAARRIVRIVRGS